MKKLLIILFLFTAAFCQSQNLQGSSTAKVAPCKTDTIKCFLYRVKHGSRSMEIGYYIAKCGRLQISKIPVNNQVKGSIWTIPPFLKNDGIDSKGNLINKEFQKLYTGGSFTDENFKKIQKSSVYQLRALE